MSIDSLWAAWPLLDIGTCPTGVPLPPASFTACPCWQWASWHTWPARGVLGWQPCHHRCLRCLAPAWRAGASMRHIGRSPGIRPSAEKSPVAVPRDTSRLTCCRAGSYKLEAETAKRNAELGRQATCPLEEVLMAQRTDVRSGELPAGFADHSAVQCSGQQSVIPGTPQQPESNSMTCTGLAATTPLAAAHRHALSSPGCRCIQCVHAPHLRTDTGVYLERCCCLQAWPATRHGLPPYVGCVLRGASVGQNARLGNALLPCRFAEC